MSSETDRSLEQSSTDNHEILQRNLQTLLAVMETATVLRSLSSSAPLQSCLCKLYRWLKLIPSVSSTVEDTIFFDQSDLRSTAQEIWAVACTDSQNAIALVALYSLADELNNLNSPMRLVNLQKSLILFNTMRIITVRSILPLQATIFLCGLLKFLKPFLFRICLNYRPLL